MTVKVRELLAELADADPEAEVVMASDAEGNNFSEFAEWGPGWFEADYWEFISPDPEPADDYAGVTEEFVPTDRHVPAICLWPV